MPTRNLHSPLGTVTESRVIINNGTYSNVIYIADIKKVNLIRERRLHANLFFMIAAMGMAAALIYNLAPDTFTRLVVAIMVLTATALAVFYKYYLYLLVIDLNNAKSLKIKTGGFRKSQLKKLYFSIRSKLAAQKSTTPAD